MSDPLMTAVAAAVATKAVEGVSAIGKSTVDAVVRLVRRKLGGEVRARGVLERAESDQASLIDQQALAEELARAAARDRFFAEELSRLWQRVSEESPGPVSNILTGEVHGNAVQARDVHGGIVFGRP